METIALPKRKVIDIKGETFRILSVMAAQQGINLKKYIENLLDQIAEERDDNATFAWLSKNMPEGLTMITEEE